MFNVIYLKTEIITRFLPAEREMMMLNKTDADTWLGKLAPTKMGSEH